MKVELLLHESVLVALRATTISIHVSIHTYVMMDNQVGYPNILP